MTSYTSSIPQLQTMRATTTTKPYPSIYHTIRFAVPRTPRLQNNHTYQNSTITAAKKPSQTLQPTPVRSAILSIRFMVPLSLVLEFSNDSFIRSASLEESRISSPIAMVIYAARGSSVISSAVSFRTQKRETDRGREYRPPVMGGIWVMGYGVESWRLWREGRREIHTSFSIRTFALMPSI